MIRHFEEELQHLKEKLLTMALNVEEMISRASSFLKTKVLSSEKEIYELESIVNKTQIQIDDACISLIALMQPTAADLRFITAAMKINSDLERMGDQAVNIWQHTSKIKLDFPQEIINLTIIISEKAKNMMKNSLEAFVKKDINMAQLILEKDDEVDDLKDKICQVLTDFMGKNTYKINQAIEMLLISRNLERIADHATNICEDVIYMVAGKDIRHHNLEEIQQ